MAEASHSSLTGSNLHNVKQHNHDADTEAGGGKLSAAVVDTFMELAEQGSAPSTPASGLVRLYAKTDGSLYQKDDAGTETVLPGGGGGGGAPTTATYVTLSSDGTLSAEKVLPFLGNYSPDKAPGSPSGTDDEFDDGSLGGSWTQTGSPDTIDEATYTGFLYIEDNDGADAGAYIGYTPGANALSVVCKLSGLAIAGNSGYLGMLLTDSSGTALATLTLQRFNATGSLLRARTGPAGLTNLDLGGGLLDGPYYLLIQRDASTNYLCFISRDGLSWLQVASFSQSGTIGRAYLIVNGQTSSNSTAAFDFIRMFASQTKVIGAAP